MLKENKRNVTVCVSAVHENPDGEREYMETRTEGRLSERESVLYVLYEEKTQKADRPVKNLLKIEKEPLRASLKKSGGICWKAVFEEGLRQETEYLTPYGAFSAGVETKSVILEQMQNKISLQLAYTLFIQGFKQADCRLDITIR